MSKHWTQTRAGKAKLSVAIKKAHTAKVAAGVPWKKAKKSKASGGKIIPLSAIGAPAQVAVRANKEVTKGKRPTPAMVLPSGIEQARLAVAAMLVQTVDRIINPR